MKRVMIFIAGLIVIGIGGAVGLRIYTKSFSPEAEARFQGENGTEIHVQYCSPYRKNRVIFGEKDVLIPYGTLWRTGANEATEVSFSTDVQVGGKRVPAGTYSLFSIPRAEAWTIILNKETGQWGTEYDPAQDFVRTEVPARTLADTTESFTIRFAKTPDENEVALVMRWENTEVRLPVQIL